MAFPGISSRKTPSAAALAEAPVAPLHNLAPSPRALRAQTGSSTASESRQHFVDGHGAQIADQSALDVGDHQAPSRRLPTERIEPRVRKACGRIVGLQLQASDREQAVGAGLIPSGGTTQAGERGSQR